MSDPRPGTSSRDLNRLCPCVRSRFIDLAGVPGLKLVVIETLRDLERQAYYVEIGVSRTLKSGHLAQPPNGLSLAVDAVPKDLLKLKNWGGPLKKGAPPHELWLLYTDMARKNELLCGADWNGGPDTGWDWPHVYLKKCLC